MAVIHSLPHCLAPRELVARWPLQHPHQWVDVLMHVVAGLLLVAGAILADSLSLWMRSLVLSLAAAVLLRARHAGRRQLTRQLDRLERSLHDGHDRDELMYRCHRVLKLDATQGAARLLMASLLLESGDALSCLLQLAPLRDAEPEQGEVVLLAALAWLQLGRPEEALLLLDALEPSEEPELENWIAELRLGLDELEQDGS